ncbi:MAG: Ribulokinase [Spirochaetes bacterium ADurb.Bin110]|jgi:FGGY-family pentulose kinase|nr:MAG: Ribulokinase [Spirochaetes bacterium ADurb.Bin110]
MNKLLSSNLFVGVDFGTQSVRVGIIDEKGKLVSSAEEGYTISFPRVGWAEQNPNDWYKAFISSWEKAIQKLPLLQRKTIKAFCICATSSTVFPVNSDGVPLSDALLWMDSRAVEQAEIINASNHPILSHCGGEVSVEWLIPKVLWFKQKDRALYEEAFRFIEQLDWINWKLSGRWVSSICNAACKANYVAQGVGWDSEFFRIIGLDDYEDKIVTEVIPVGGLIGYLKREFCEMYGLNRSVSLYQGGIDAYIAVLGLGVVQEGILGTILGTSFVELCLSKKPLEIEGIWGPYRDVIINGYYALEGGQISAGSIAKWFKDMLSNRGSMNFMKISYEAKESGVGAHNLIALDFFQGNRTPFKNPRARGALWGLNLSHSRGDIYRALLESVALGTRNIISNFNSFGYRFDKWVACGGVTKDKLWMSIISDSCGIPISLLNSSSYAGLMGCAIISAVSSGMFKNYDIAASAMLREVASIEPEKRNHERYDEIYGKYLELCHIMNTMTQGK